MGFLLTLLHAAQAAYSGWNLYLASISVSNLQKYENTSEKAAKYSNKAADQLYKTRTTQASLALSVLLSFSTSTYLLLKGGGNFTEFVAAGLNVAALVAAREHVGNFWEGGLKVPGPGMGLYNEAWSKTQEVRLNMLYLGGSWALAGVVGLLF